MKLFLVVLAVVLVTVSARGRHRRHRDHHEGHDHSGHDHAGQDHAGHNHGSNNGPPDGAVGMPAGAFSDVDDKCQANIREAAQKAVTLAHNENHELVWIDSVQKQIVAGIKYKITAYCRDTGSEMIMKCDYELVHVQWAETNDPYSLLEYSCVDADGSEFGEQCPETEDDDNTIDGFF